MRKYLLDNGPLVALVKGRPGAERLMRPWVEHDEAATSILVYGEALEYFKTSPDYDRHRNNLRALLQGVTAYRLSYPILERYADVRLALRPGGHLIGDVDTLIAATALEHGLTSMRRGGPCLQAWGKRRPPLLVWYTVCVLKALHRRMERTVAVALAPCQLNIAGSWRETSPG